MVSQEFKNALKLHPVPKHELAWQIGISPSQLNHLINNHQKVELGDKRLIRIARLIDFPENRIFDREKKKRDS